MITLNYAEVSSMQTTHHVHSFLPPNVQRNTQGLIRVQHPNDLQCNATPPVVPGASHSLEDGNSTEDESSQAADGAVLSRTSGDDAGSGASRGTGGARAGAAGGAGGVRRGRVRRRGGGGARGSPGGGGRGLRGGSRAGAGWRRLGCRGWGRGAGGRGGRGR